MKRVILTGATGYLGSRLALSLLGKLEIMCIATNNAQLGYLTNNKSNMLFLETGSPHFQEKIKKFSPDFVIHCAAIYERGDVTLPQLVDANYSFPARVLDAVTFNSKKVHWINTSTSLEPYINIYSLLKHQFSQLGKLYAERNKLTFNNILLEQFYGEKDSGDKFIPFLIANMKEDKSIPLTDGLQRRDFIYVEDVIQAYHLLLKADLDGYNEFPLGSGEAPQIKEVVEYLKIISSSASILSFGEIARRKNEPLVMMADISRFQELGFLPAYSWKKGLKKTWEGTV